MCLLTTPGGWWECGYWMASGNSGSLWLSAPWPWGMDNEVFHLRHLSSISAHRAMAYYMVYYTVIWSIMFFNYFELWFARICDTKSQVVYFIQYGNTWWVPLAEVCSPQEWLDSPKSRFSQCFWWAFSKICCFVFFPSLIEGIATWLVRSWGLPGNINWIMSLNLLFEILTLSTSACGHIWKWRHWGYN